MVDDDGGDGEAKASTQNQDAERGDNYWDLSGLIEIYRD